MKDYSGGRGAKLVRYLNRVFRPEDATLREARERSLAAGLPEIQVGTMDALHLEVLTRAAGLDVEMYGMGVAVGVGIMVPGGKPNA